MTMVLCTSAMYIILLYVVRGAQRASCIIRGNELVVEAAVIYLFFSCLLHVIWIRKLFTKMRFEIGIQFVWITIVLGILFTGR